MDLKNWALQLVEEHKNPLVRFEIEKTKLFLPGGDKEEGDILAQRIGRFKRVLQSHRVERRCARNKIKWLVEDNIGLVEKSVGVKHKFMGFQNKNGKFVYPEEAFFLLETNRAEILFNDIPLNIDQAFTIILKTREALNKYRIYQKLAVAGYILKKPNVVFKSLKHNSSKILKKIEKSPLAKIEKSPSAKLEKSRLVKIEKSPLAKIQNSPSAKIKKSQLANVEKSPLPKIEKIEDANLNKNCSDDEAPLDKIQKGEKTSLNKINRDVVEMVEEISTKQDKTIREKLNQNIGIEIDKCNEFEPPAKKIKRNHKKIKLEKVTNETNQSKDSEEEFKVEEESTSAAASLEDNENDKFRDFFLKLQARGPKHNKRIVEKPCDYKVELNTCGRSKQGSLHFILDGELDPGIGFYKEDDLNIYCNATTDVIFTRISSVELPNLF